LNTFTRKKTLRGSNDKEKQQRENVRKTGSSPKKEAEEKKREQGYGWCQGGKREGSRRMAFCHPRHGSSSAYPNRIQKKNRLRKGGGGGKERDHNRFFQRHPQGPKPRPRGGGRTSWASSTRPATGGKKGTQRISMRKLGAVQLPKHEIKGKRKRPN